MRAVVPLRIVLVAAVLAIPRSPVTAAPASGPLAFVNVTVIPMTEPGVLRARTVVTRGGVITSVTASSDAPPSDAHVIDGTGRYLMPGLADMHVHLQPADRGDVNRRMLALFLATGVTMVRNMLGSPGILELRDAVARGREAGPTIVTSGPILDGPGSAWTDNVAKITTSADAERVVARQQAEGYDFIKIYSRLSPEAYAGVIAAARRRGLQVAGHVPVTVPIADVLAAHQSSIEHLLGYLDAIEADTSPVHGRQGWDARMQAFAYVDSTKMAPIARATRDAGVWNCPTLVAMRNWVPAEQASALLDREEMRYVPFEVREHWLPWKGFRLETFGPSDFALAERARQVYRALVGALATAGADILVGTDTPTPFVLPGFSMADELKNLVDAGLTPYQALSGATSAPARFLNQPARFGRVAIGARADLLLLEGNPLEDVGQVRRPTGVVVRGAWYDRQQLDRLLER